MAHVTHRRRRAMALKTFCVTEPPESEIHEARLCQLNQDQSVVRAYQEHLRMKRAAGNFSVGDTRMVEAVESMLEDIIEQMQDIYEIN